MGLLNDFFRRGLEGGRGLKGADKPKASRPAPTVQSQANLGRSNRPPVTPRPQTYRPAPAQAQPAARTYTVQSGDTLSEIAQRFYGDPQAYRRIFDANRDILSDPDRIQPGQALKIPT